MVSSLGFEVSVEWQFAVLLTSVQTCQSIFKLNDFNKFPAKVEFCISWMVYFQNRLKSVGFAVVLWISRLRMKTSGLLICYRYIIRGQPYIYSFILCALFHVTTNLRVNSVFNSVYIVTSDFFDRKLSWHHFFISRAFQSRQLFIFLLVIQTASLVTCFRA